jgi:hypothetical protein
MVENDLIMMENSIRTIIVYLTYVVVSSSVIADASVPPELVDTEGTYKGIMAGATYTGRRRCSRVCGSVRPRCG